MQVALLRRRITSSVRLQFFEIARPTGPSGTRSPALSAFRQSASARLESYLKEGDKCSQE